jgi:thioredoxin reductase
MQFWSHIAEAGSARYLKSFCFATNLSSPRPGYTLADFNAPRGLETFEPCSMSNFVEYGKWFQQHNIPWTEPVDVVRVESTGRDFRLTLSNGERLATWNVVVATGLACFATVPSVMASLPAGLVMHTSAIGSFTPFQGKSVAIIGAGQSALEAAALLHEVGAVPELLVREDKIRWHTRVYQDRSLWQRIRRPMSGLGVGPKAWALYTYPGALNRLPERWRIQLTKNHLPPEGAWWLRERVENLVPVSYETTVVEAREEGGRVVLQTQSARGGKQRSFKVDHVVAGSGYDISVKRLNFLDPQLRSSIDCVEGAPRLNARFEASVPGLYFAGPTSAMSFGPLFRFVVGADYTARTVSSQLASRVSAQVHSQVSYAA